MKLVTIAVVLALFFVFLELSYHVIQYVRWGPTIKRSLVTNDPELGYALNPKQDVIFEPSERNACSEAVLRRPPVSKYLLKEPIFKDGKRILFLGASFVQTVTVSSGSAYFDVFEKLGKGRYSVYAAGVQGYNDLQEYLLLKRVYNQAQPEIVVWQLSANDPYSNVFFSQIFSGAEKPRPYLNLKTGNIEFHESLFFILRVSGLLQMLRFRLQWFDRTHQLGIVDFLNSLTLPNAQQMMTIDQEGLEVLRRLLHRAVVEYPKTRFIGFSVDGQLEDRYQKIFSEMGADYFPKFSMRYMVKGGKINCTS